MSDLQDVRELSAYSLADLAECGNPSGPTTAGADFLVRVRDAVDEAMTWHTEQDDMTPRDAIDHIADARRHELADSAVPIYTGDRWATFVDLSAFDEDVSELGEVDASDLTSSVAGVALYMIADRLIGALLDDLGEWADEEPEEEDEDVSWIVTDATGKILAEGFDTEEDAQDAADALQANGHADARTARLN